MNTLEGHTEVVSRRVKRKLLVLYNPSPHGIGRCLENVESSHAWMAIGGEVKVAVGAEGGKHLIAWRVNWSSQVLHTSKAGRKDAYLPDVVAAESTWHIAHEVEPIAVG